MRAGLRRTAVVVGASVVAVLATAVTTADADGLPAAAPPHVVEQANALTGQQQPSGQDTPVPVPAFIDGCNRGYGLPTQCIPLRAPRNQPMGCAYLKEYGFLRKPLPVRDDNLHLVRHGRVCG